MGSNNQDLGIQSDHDFKGKQLMLQGLIYLL